MKKPDPKNLPAPDGLVDQYVRASTGRYGYPKGGAPKRRLRCSKCPRTWKFSYKLLHTVCPVCEEGRLS